MSNKTLAFELKIEGVKSEINQLAKLENELFQVTEFIKLFKKEGSDFTKLISEQKKLKLSIAETNKEIAKKNKEFEKQFATGDTLANKQRQWNRVAREMAKQEIAEQKQITLQRKKDVQAAIDADEIKKKSVIGMRLEVQKLQREYYLLSEAERNSRTGKSLNSTLANKTQNLQNIERSVGVHSRNIGNYPQAIGMVASNMTGGLIGSGVVGGIVAGAALATAAAKQIISLNSEIDGLQANVRKTTNLNNDSVERLTKRLKDLDTSTTLQELLQISIEAGRFGVQGEKAVGDFTEAVNLLNVALGDEFGGGVEQITTEVSQLSNVMYGVTNDGTVMADRFQRIGNALNVLANSGSATAGQIADISSRIAGTGKMFGYTEGQIMGIASTIKELGIDVERGSTAFNKINIIMRKNVGDFAKLAGMSKDKFKELMDSKPWEAFELIIKKTNELSGGSGTKMANLLNELGIRANGASELFSKMGRNLGLANTRIDQGTGALTNINSLLSEQQNMMDSIPGQWARLKNAMSDLFVSSGLQNFIKGSLATMSDWLATANEIGFVNSMGWAGAAGVGAKRQKRNLNNVINTINSQASVSQSFDILNNAGKSNIPKFLDPNSGQIIKKTSSNNVGNSSGSGKTSTEIKAAIGSVAYFEDQIKNLEDRLNKTANVTLIESIKKKLQELNIELNKAKLLIDPENKRAYDKSLGDLKPLESKGTLLETSTYALVGYLDDKNSEEIIDHAKELSKEIGDATLVISQDYQNKNLEQLKSEQQQKKEFILSTTEETINNVFALWNAMEQKRADQSIARLEAEYDHKLEKAKGNATLEAAIQKELDEKKLAIEKETRRKQKQMAIAQALINGALAITKIWANTVDVTPVQGFKIAASIASAASTAFQVALINAQSFAKGGFTGKGLLPPDATGERPVGIVHEDEFVFDKYTTKRYRPFFEAIHNGKITTYATGGFVSPVPSVITPYEIMKSSISRDNMIAFASIVAQETKIAVYEGAILASEENVRMRERKQAQISNSIK